MRMSSATVAERDPTLRKCAEPQHNKPQVILYAYIVVVLTTLQENVVTSLTTTEKSQSQHQGTLRIKDPG